MTRIIQWVPPAMAFVTAGSFYSRAEAAFPQATCSTSPSFDAPIPVNIGATEYDPQALAPAGNVNDGTLYNFNTNGSYRLIVNSNVSALQPYYGLFQTESGYDYLKVTGNTTNKYTGNLNSSSNPVASGTTWSPYASLGGGAGELAVQWYSDVSIAPYLPPAMVQVAAQCASAQTTQPPGSTFLDWNNRVDGLLLKTGDVLYFNFYQEPNSPLLITMTALATSYGADFDLYASFSQQFPDDSSFDYRGYTSYPSEALDIPAVAYGRTVYIGVHAYRGGGHFSLHGLQQAPAERHSLTVCPVGFTLTPSQQQTLLSFLQAGAARLLSASNGNTWNNGFTVLQTASSCASYCSVCLQTTGNTSYGGPNPNPEGCGQINLGGGNWGLGAGLGWLYAHESGHACFGYPDEYEPPAAGSATPMLCGHSIMSNHGYTTHWCSIAHCLDGHQFDSTVCNPWTSNSMWVRYAQGGHLHFGPDWGCGYGTQGCTKLTADPSDYTKNPNLLNLVNVTFLTIQ